jgi:hypothetical protein
MAELTTHFTVDTHPGHDDNRRLAPIILAGEPRSDGGKGSVGAMTSKLFTTWLRRMILEGYADMLGAGTFTPDSPLTLCLFVDGCSAHLSHDISSFTTDMLDEHNVRILIALGHPNTTAVYQEQDVVTFRNFKGTAINSEIATLIAAQRQYAACHEDAEPAFELIGPDDGAIVAIARAFKAAVAPNAVAAALRAQGIGHYLESFCIWMASEGYRKVERYGLSDGRANRDDEQHVAQHLSADKAPSASDMDKFCIDYFKALCESDPLAAATGAGPQRMQKIKRPTAAQASRFPFMNLQRCHIDAMAPPFRDALQGMRLPGEAFDTYYKMARDRNAARKKKEERKKHATAERRAQWTTTVLEMNIKDPGDFYARLVLPEDMTCTQLKAVLFCVFGVETPDSGFAKSDLIARLRKEMADNPDKLPRRLDYSQCPARSTNKDHSCTSVCPLPEAVLFDKPADIPLPRPPKALQVQSTDDA